MRIRRILMIGILAFLALGSAGAAKVTIRTVFKNAKVSIKEGKGQSALLKQLKDSLAAGHLSLNEQAECYYYSMMLEQSLNDGLNQKAYLKQAYDTMALFNTVYNIYSNYVLCQKVDEHNKHLREGRELLTLHRKNLLVGGKYLFTKKNWKDSFRFLDMFIGTRQAESDSLMGQVAYLATLSAFNMQDHASVLKHVDLAMANTSQAILPSLAEYRSRSILALGDSARWVETLEEGSDRFLGYKYFFLNLIDYYLDHGMYQKAIHRTDSLMKRDEDRRLYWYAKSLVALAMSDYDYCIEMGKECLSRDAECADAMYNIGVAYCNKAARTQSNVEKMSFFRQALPYMEDYRRLAPDAMERWSGPLYNIYMYLNMGDKFDEIDHLMHSKKS